MVLLEGGLRVGVDPVGQVEDLVTCGLDRGGEAGLVVLVGRGGARGGDVGHAVSWLGETC